MDKETVVGMKFLMQMIGVVGSWMLLPKDAFCKTDDIILRHYKIYGSRADWETVIEMHQKKVLAASFMIIYFIMSSGFALLEIPDAIGRVVGGAIAGVTIGTMFLFKYVVIKCRLKNVNKVLERTKQSLLK